MSNSNHDAMGLPPQQQAALFDTASEWAPHALGTDSKLRLTLVLHVVAFACVLLGRLSTLAIGAKHTLGGCSGFLAHGPAAPFRSSAGLSLEDSFRWLGSA